MKLTKVDPEHVYYNFEDEVDFSQYEDKMVIAGNRDFQSFGDDTLIGVVYGKYYDEDQKLYIRDDGTCFEDEIGYDYETAEELEKISGKKNWVEGKFSGYSQGDWQTIWYVKDEVNQNEIEYMEAFYMGKMSEFRDEDDCCYFVPDDIAWDGKDAICDYLGLDKNDTEVYDENDDLIE